jgi:dihydroorotate dehydrogenase (NAD+) catalytic subunit
VLGPGQGGLSGPALKPIALAAVATCYRVTGLPIVGMGGVRTGLDALEFVAAGARHVAVGTTLFADPNAPARIRRELHAAAHERGWNTYEDAYAAAHEDALSLRTT